MTAEKYHSDNVFFPGSQSIYVYNSPAEFYADAEDYKANPNRTASPVTLGRFQLRYNNIPGAIEPLQPLEVLSWGGYIQDSYRPSDKLTSLCAPTFILRQHRLREPARQCDDLPRRDWGRGAVPHPRTPEVDADLLAAIRLQLGPEGRSDHAGPWWDRPLLRHAALRLDLQPDRPERHPHRLRSGRFSTKTRPFHPDPFHYAPTNVTGAPASSYELEYTDEDFKFSQIWRRTSPSTNACRGASLAPPSSSTTRTSMASITSTPICRPRARTTPAPTPVRGTPATS